MSGEEQNLKSRYYPGLVYRRMWLDSFGSNEGAIIRVICFPIVEGKFQTWFIAPIFLEIPVMMLFEYVASLNGEPVFGATCIYQECDLSQYLSIPRFSFQESSLGAS